MKDRPQPVVLITGGAGFIGSHTADALLRQGYAVRALDILDPQVHGSRTRPDYLSPQVELHVGDVCDPAAVRRALNGASYVYHFAAQTGVGQSMYALRDYFHTNVTGTAVLWQEIKNSRAPIRKFVLASSRAVYGEGKYLCPNCGITYPQGRDESRLLAGDWWQYCAQCGRRMTSLPTDEDSPVQVTSVYGLTKKIQEEISMMMRAALNIPIVILRYFNVYGPRQALSNPYTGLLASFCTRLLSGSPITLYEQGVPARDFIHVTDIVAANLLALDADPGVREILNVGTGRSVTLNELGETFSSVLDRPAAVRKTAKFRAGDILACFADMQRANSVLGFRPEVSLNSGLRSLIEWVTRHPGDDRSEMMEQELSTRGILKEASGKAG